MPTTRGEAILKCLLGKQKEVRGEKVSELNSKAVANVNKNGELEKNKRKGQKLLVKSADKAKKQGKRQRLCEEQDMEVEEIEESLNRNSFANVDQEMEPKQNKFMKAGGGRKNGKAKRKLEMNEVDNTIDMEDEQQCIKMHVEADEDTFGQTDTELSSDSEGDDEVQTQDSQSEVQFRVNQLAKEIEVSRKTQGQELAAANWMENPPSTSGVRDVDLQRQKKDDKGANSSMTSQQIMRIDQEMKDKIKDLHEMMIQQGLTGSCEALEKYFDENGQPKKLGSTGKDTLQNVQKIPNQKNKTNRNHNATIGTNNIAISTMSEATIYDRAVQKRNSSSSEEAMDCSDESLENNDVFLLVDRRDNVEMAMQVGGQEVMNQAVTPEDRAREMIKEAEMAKARIFPPKGENLGLTQNTCNAEGMHKVVDYVSQMPQDQVLPQGNIPFELIAQADYDYLVIGGHVDETMQQKIVKGEYIDFGKLIPRDRIMAEEDGRMELVVRNGKTFWTPVCETVTINSFNRWEQAFRIYSNIYTRAHPHKSSKLIQYNHVIHSISLTYVWDNVYGYDKEFRLHLSKHPDRNWAVILQQAWSMKLRDRITNTRFGEQQQIRHPANGGNNMGESNGGAKFAKGDACKLYNRGYCRFGNSCKFAHKCSYCGKMGHAIINCRNCRQTERGQIREDQVEIRDLLKRKGLAK